MYICDLSRPIIGLVAPQGEAKAELRPGTPKGVALVACPVILEGRFPGIHLSGDRRSSFTVNKLECSKQA